MPDEPKPTESQTPPTETPAPSDVAVPKPTPSFPSLDDDLAAVMNKGASPPPAEPPAKETPTETPPEETSTPEETPAETPSDTQPETPPETPEDDLLMGPVAKKLEVKPKEPKPETLKAPELRKEYARVKGRLAEAEKELAALKNGKPSENTYTEEITKLKGQLDEHRKVIRSVAYEQSEEFKQKFQQPFEDAWQQGVNYVTRLSIQQDDGSTRQGTEADFTRIMTIPDDGQAATLANELFGGNAFYVLNSRVTLQNLHYQRNRALEEFRQDFNEREKLAADQTQKQAQEVESQKVKNKAMFDQLNKQAAEKHPEYFAPVTGDDEGNSLLVKGYEDADLMFSAANMPNDKRIALHSAVRNRAAAFYRLVHQLRGKDAEIEQLQKELKEIKESTPGDGQEKRSEGGEAPKRSSIEDDLQAVARNY